ncbi:MAG TPA: CBS domain-containing protein [Streptomyces sp.]|nr:CBS domain-containing protein [Streptomyces sp.]
MSDFEHHAAGREARRTLPGRSWTPQEEHRQETLRRYLGAVAAAATSAAGGAVPSAEEAEADRTAAGSRPRTPVPPRVRDVMSSPAVRVPGDLPFLEIARTLSRTRLSAVPVVDAEERVIGVVSESDLLARAAALAEPHRHGVFGRFRERRAHERSHGETAVTLMTFPPVTARPWQLVSDAAWTAARSRVKRLPVVDHHDRLVGVVGRGDLLRALVREDEEIRQDVESLLREELPTASAAFRVTVDDGVVTLTGGPETVLASGLLDSVRAVTGVVDVVDATGRPAEG